MKRPTLPENHCFWLSVIKDTKTRKRFEERGNIRQRRNLEKIRRYMKWQNIQITKAGD